jgi:hypothetical protein
MSEVACRNAKASSIRRATDITSYHPYSEVDARARTRSTLASKPAHHLSATSGSGKAPRVAYMTTLGQSVLSRR